MSQKTCVVCGQQIPAKRLEAKPNARECVPCLEKAGDVKRVKRYDEHDQWGNEIAQVYFTDDPELEARLRRIQNSTHFPTADELIEDDTNPIIDSSNHISTAFEVAISENPPGKVLVIKSSQEVNHGNSTSERAAA
jgi:hypothetical protein